MRVFCKLIAMLKLKNLVALLGSLGSLQAYSQGMIQVTHPETGDDTKVGAYISSQRGFSTATYWIEAPEGLILIDTQFLTSAAEAAIQAATKHTGKKIVAAFILHANPDKFNGAEVFKKAGARVITSNAIRNQIPAVHTLRKSWFYDRFKPDYPESAPEVEGLNEKSGEKSRKLTIAGTELVLHFLGRGCSEAHLVIEWKGHLFVGDLVANDYHSWLELGFVDAWGHRIEELMEINSEWIHPGRGPTGDASLLEQQLHYLKTVSSIVKVNSKMRNRKLAREKVEAKILEAFPGYRYPLFVSRGIDALVR